MRQKLFYYVTSLLPHHFREEGLDDPKCDSTFVSKVLKIQRVERENAMRGAGVWPTV